MQIVRDVDPPGEGHGKGLDCNRLEIEDPRIEVDGAERAGCDDNALELREHRLHGKTGVQAAQLLADTHLERPLVGDETGVAEAWRVVVLF